MACGPDLSGQCIGPDICCGPFGCYLGTEESSICQKENESTHACEVQGDPCGSRDQGNCVGNGICCDSGRYLQLFSRVHTKCITYVAIRWKNNASCNVYCN